MSDPLTQMAERLGLTLEALQLRVAANANQPEDAIDGLESDDRFSRTATHVENGPELQRVLRLPRRPVPSSDDPAMQQFAQVLTGRLARTASPYPGPLFPVQAAALQECWQHGGAFLPIRVGGGKAQPNTEPVLTAHGWRPIGHVRKGDFVYGSDGHAHEVLGVFPQGVRPIYRLTFSDGTTALCDVDHQWTFDVATSTSHTGKRRETRTLREWLPERLKRKCGDYEASRVFLPMGVPIQYPDALLPVDPYTLGVLLGDGGLTQKSVSLASMDREIIDALVLPEGVQARARSSTSSGKATQYGITLAQHTMKQGGRDQNIGRGKGFGGGSLPNPLYAQLDALGLMGCDSETKFIPPMYFRGSVAQRLSLLQGLFDTDGSATRDAVDITVKAQCLAEGVAELVESLGGTAVQFEKWLVYKGENLRYFRVRARLPRELVPFKLARKVAINRAARAQRPPFRALESIEYVGEQEATCISVAAPDRLYVTRHHILTHNTLTAYLAPTVMGAKRPIYIAPASLEKDVEREFKLFALSWRGPHPQGYPFVSYQELGHPNAGEKRDKKKQLIRASLLDRLKPDLIVFDEAHFLKNVKTAAVAKRVRRYLQENPHCRIVAMSGTMMNDSLLDFAHILRWCLPRSCPLPTTYPELKPWADAVDEKDSLAPRPDVGALIQFCSGQELHALNEARDAWDVTERTLEIVRGALGRRIVETPGVVSTQDGPLGIPLEIAECGPSPEDPKVDEFFRFVRARWELPDGQPIADGLQMARHGRSMGLGFWQRWVVQPPEPWLKLRKEWCGFVREKVKAHWLKLDSEKPVKEAVKDGRLEDYGLLAEWEAIEPTFTPETEAVWFSDEAVHAAYAWLARTSATGVGGIVWVHHIDLGVKLEQALGIPYYGDEGKDRRGKFILDHTPGKPMIASISSNGTGRNLQKGWSANLWFCTPAEQSLGRTHRKGQLADKVTNHVYFGSWEHVALFYKKLAKAKGAQDTGLCGAQRLVYADKQLPTLSEVELRFSPVSGQGARWYR